MLLFFYKILNQADFRGSWRALKLIKSLIIWLGMVKGRTQSLYGPIVRISRRDWTTEASVFGLYGFELVSLIKKMPRDGVFIDIGSNIGIFSLLAATHLREGTVFTFEPNALVYGDLLENIRLNRLNNITPFNFGISRTTGLAKFNFDIAHTGKGHIASPQEDATTQALFINAPLLDKFISIDPRSRCICKIDTEGAEFMVIREIFKTSFHSSVNLFYVEVNSGRLKKFGSSVSELYGLMQERGFVGKKGEGYSSHYDEIFHRHEDAPPMA